MMTEPRSPELYPPPSEPVPCRWCSGPIVNTVLGWMHVNEHGVPPTGWLCAMPHMHLAEPRTEVTLAIDLGTESTAARPGPASAARPGEPSRRPTPIPPRKGAHQADIRPSEWPPSPGSGDWWEHRG